MPSGDEPQEARAHRRTSLPDVQRRRPDSHSCVRRLPAGSPRRASHCPPHIPPCSAPQDCRLSLFHTAHPISVNRRRSSGNTPQTAPVSVPSLQSLQSAPLPVHSAPPPVHLSPCNIPDIPNPFLLTNNKSRAIAGFVSHSKDAARPCLYRNPSGFTAGDVLFSHFPR